MESNVKVRDKAGKVVGRTNKTTVPKTKKGIRTIPMNSQCKEYLLRLKAYAEKQGIVTDYVAYTNKGAAISSRNLQRALDVVLNNAGIPHCGLHTLRHSFGSALLRKGASIESVSSLMGHSSIKITYDKYIHVLEEQKVVEMQKLNIT